MCPPPFLAILLCEPHDEPPPSDPHCLVLFHTHILPHHGRRRGQTVSAKRRAGRPLSANEDHGPVLGSR